MRRIGIMKRSPYALQFVDGLSPQEIKDERRRYARFSKADLFDVFSDLVRQIDGEVNIRHIFNEIARRKIVLTDNGMR